MFKKLVIVKKTLGNTSFAIPPCVGQIQVEAYGGSSLKQCVIPQSGGAGAYGTVATVCASTYCLSQYGGGNYSRSIIQVSNATVLYTTGTASASCTGQWWVSTASNAAPSTSTQGVMAYNGGILGSGIGQLTFSGGKNGRKYFKNYRYVNCGKSGSYTYYGFVFGGYGGQAGPNGPGGNGSSAYPTGSYVASISYNTGAGGGSNGGSNAVKAIPGVSRWGASATGIGSGGVPQGGLFNFSVGYTGTIDQTVDFFPSCGPRGGTGGISTCACSVSPNLGPCTSPTQNDGMLVITGYQNTRPALAGTYRYIFTSSGVTIPAVINCISITNAKTYTMCIPIGTTSTEVRVLGGGSGGNTNCGYYTTSTTYPSAGGGGGGYARSTYTTAVTATGVTLSIRISCPGPGGTYNNSAVFINGVVEALAYAAGGARGGGAPGGLGTNYARNGVTRIGGYGGRGYSSGLSVRGGGGGGAAWDGGVGGNGGGVLGSTYYSAGGGGAARCSAAGCSAGSSTTAPTAGANSGAIAGTGGAAVSTAVSPGNPGSNGGGGGASGKLSAVSQGGAGGIASIYNSANVYAANIIQVAAATPYFGPGGGGGGSYASSTGDTGIGGAGGYGGGGGGGGGSGGSSSAGQGGGGLVVVTFQICGALAASYFNSTASNTISQSAVIS